MAQFLSYVFERTIENDLDSLKETCIGVAVFERNPSYAPREDGIVRVEARRLRSKLQQYYENEGRDDLWVLTLPKGSYKLVFHRRVSPEPVNCVSPVAAEVLIGDVQSPPTKMHSTTLTPALSVSAPTQSIGEDRQAKSTQSHVGSLGKTLTPSLFTWSLFVAATCFCIGIGFLYSSLTSLPLRPEAKSARLTTQIGQELQPAISPNGKYFAYVWDGGIGKYNVYLQTIIGGAVRQLTQGSVHHLYPVWSPDGRDIAYVRMSAHSLELVLIPVDGGVERVVSSFAPSAPPWHADASQISGHWSVSWSASGHELISNVVRMNEGKEAIALFSIALDRFEAPKQVTHPRGAEIDNDPTVSPNGKFLAFFRSTSKLTGDVWLIDLVSGNERQLTNSRADVAGITWTPDGKSIIYSSAKDGVYALWSFELKTAKERLIRSEGADLKDPKLSRDGTKLVFSESTTTSNIWQQALDANGLPQGAPFRLLPSSRNSQSARLSPDGRQIAFVSNRSGHWELWRADKDGEHPSQLTKFEGPLVDAPHWSPLGDQIVFEARPGGRSAIFSIAAIGGSPKRLTQTDADEKMPVWSSDGKWIYFNSTATGRPLIWRMNPDGGQRSPVCNQTGWDLVARTPNLIFLSQDQYLYTVPESGGKAERLNRLGPVGFSRYFAYAPDALYFIRDEDEPTVYRYDFETSRLQSVMRLPERIVSSTPSLSLSPDGKSLLFAQQENASSAIFTIPFRR